MLPLSGCLTLRKCDTENTYHKENVLLQHSLPCIIILKQMEAETFKYMGFKHYHSTVFVTRRVIK